jgi:hypothetical protein
LVVVVLLVMRWRNWRGGWRPRPSPHLLPISYLFLSIDPNARWEYQRSINWEPFCNLPILLLSTHKSKNSRTH